jgi:hypothetical protein
MLMRCLIFPFVVLTLMNGSAFAAGPLLPDPKLTPGAVQTADAGKICQRGHSRTVRHTSARLKHQVYAE